MQGHIKPVMNKNKLIKLHLTLEQNTNICKQSKFYFNAQTDLKSLHQAIEYKMLAKNLGRIVNLIQRRVDINIDTKFSEKIYICCNFYAKLHLNYTKTHFSILRGSCSQHISQLK